MQEPHGFTFRTERRFRERWIACAMFSALACGDGVETASHQDAHDDTKSPATTADASTARLNDAGARATEASADAMTPAKDGGSTSDDGSVDDAAPSAVASDGGMNTTAPSGPVAAACMGHAGESVCDDAVLIHCGAGGTAESSTTCASAARCRAGLATGKCGDCDPGIANCAGLELQECSGTGTFMHIDTCDSEALCSESNKSCDPSRCGMDAVKCENGYLKTCKADLSGFDDGVQCAKPELCSEADKRCNECTPDEKVCAKDSDTLMVCSTDGKGPTSMPCEGDTPRCLNGKCVQCKKDEDCSTEEDCRVARCDTGTGMCTTANADRKAKCMGGAGVCDLLGACKECLDDTGCVPCKRCSLLGTCTDRQPLAVSPSIFGGCDLSLTAGYALNLDQRDLSAGDQITGTIGFQGVFTVTSTTNTQSQLVTEGSDTRTISVAGPSGTSCDAQVLTTSSVSLTFTGGSSATPPTITVSAVHPSK